MTGSARTWVPLAFALVLVGGYFAYEQLVQSEFGTVNPLVLPAQQEERVTPPREIPSGFREFTSSRYKFSVLYPEDLTVEEYPAEGGASTFTFQNTDTVQGFQMYVLPYKDLVISEERFRKDVPSGIREGEVIIEIGGISASKFYSRHVALGDTVEIWMIRDGYLYELTTHRSLEPFLLEVVKTWRFLPS